MGVVVALVGLDWAGVQRSHIKNNKTTFFGQIGVGGVGGGAAGGHLSY